MKCFLTCVSLLTLFATKAIAIITYGESNATATVKYDNSATAAEYSVVFVEAYAGYANSASGVYLGNGWFLTANHVSTPLGGLVSQNGESALITYVDNSLNQKYNVDLKLFYVSDVENFDYLTSINLSKDIYTQLEETAFSLYRNRFTGKYYVEAEAGTYLSLVGAGYGSSATTNTPNASVESDAKLGTVHSGESSIFFFSADGYVVTLAETITGSAKAMNGDSGGGMFYQDSNGNWYIVATLAASQTSLPFGSYNDVEIVYNASGTPTSLNADKLMSTCSTSAGVNLQNYIDEINAIIATTPIPEPSTYAFIFGILSITFVVFKRK